LYKYAFALNIDLKKINGVDNFVISNIDAKYTQETQKRYLKLQILNKKADKQFYKELNNNYFDFISLFNSSNNVDIIIGAKKGYELFVKKEPNALIVYPKKITKENLIKKKENYVSSSLFVKPVFSVNLVETKPTPQNIFFSGLDAYSHENYKQATAEFSKLANNPNSPFFLNAMYLLALSYEKIGDYEKAIKTYHEILGYSLELDAPAKILYQIAQIYKKQGDGRYIDTLKKIVEQYPYSKWSDEAKFELGNDFFKAKKYNQAVLYYSSITKESPLYEIGMLKAAYIFYLEQNYPQAAYLLYLINLNDINLKHNEKYIAAAAYVFCRMKDFKSAENALSYIKNTKSADFYIAKTECELLQNKPQLAQNTINEALSIFASNKEIEEEKIKVDVLRNQLSERELESIVNKYKNNEKIISLAIDKLAKIYYDKKEYLKVLNLYAKNKDLVVDSVDGFKSLAQDSLNKYAQISGQNLNDRSMYEALRLAKNLKLNLNSCDLAKGFMFFDQYNYAFESLDKASECLNIIKANYEIKKGNVKGAMATLGSIKDKDYLNMIFGKLSYIEGDLNKSRVFFERCLKSKDNRLKQFSELEIVKINIESNSQNKPIDSKNFQAPFAHEADFLNGLYYFNKKDYSNALKNFEKVENIKRYNERALFYETLCLINTGQKSLAQKKLSTLQKDYPDSLLSKKLKILLQ
jgi:TolA-binding protein